jgi:hypothetical protein
MPYYDPKGKSRKAVIQGKKDYNLIFIRKDSGYVAMLVEIRTY